MGGYSRVFVLAASVALGGCGIVGGDDEQEVTLYVAPMTTTCFGPFERQCLLVKESPDALYELFYDTIQGFEYEAGYSYVIRAAWKPVPNPPQDASSRSYRLISVESKVPEPT
jgi:hypothetical protein